MHCIVWYNSTPIRGTRRQHADARLRLPGSVGSAKTSTAMALLRGLRCPWSRLARIRLSSAPPTETAAAASPLTHVQHWRSVWNEAVPQSQSYKAESFYDSTVEKVISIVHYHHCLTGLLRPNRPPPSLPEQYAQMPVEVLSLEQVRHHTSSPSAAGTAAHCTCAVSAACSCYTRVAAVSWSATDGSAAASRCCTMGWTPGPTQTGWYRAPALCTRRCGL